MAAQVAALSSALAKLPDHVGIVYRGTSLTAAQLVAYVPGTVVTELGFTSTTKDRGQAISGNACFVVRSVHGKDISALSQVPEESEVLFDHGTSFRVVGQVLDPRLGLTFIELSEHPGIESPEGHEADLDAAVAGLQDHLHRHGVPPDRAVPSKFDGAIGASLEGVVQATGRVEGAPASGAEVAADVQDHWPGRINELLYVVQFRPILDQAVVESVAQRVLERSVLTSGAGTYLRSIELALASDRSLADGTDPNHSEAEIRQFLAGLRDHLLSARPGGASG